MSEWTTERLHLRPWQHADADTLLEIRSNPEIAKWLGSPEPWSTISQAELAISDWADTIQDDGPNGVWAIIPRGHSVPVGTVSLGTLPESRETEVGWYLHPGANGNGWATEAATSAIERGIASGVRRIWALMWQQNEPSAKVARACGMRELGVLVDPWYGSEEDPYSRMFVARSDTERERKNNNVGRSASKATSQ